MCQACFHAWHMSTKLSAINSVNSRFFEVGDRRLNQAPSMRGFSVAKALAQVRVIGRFADGFSAMDEDDLAREIDKVMHDRLPSFAMIGGTLQAKCDDSL